MDILYITQFFYPEIGATTNRALANAKYLSKQGHKVTVLTEIPNHPQGVLYDGYKKKLFQKEKQAGFDIHRIWVYIAAKKNFLTRLLFYLSFMFGGFIYSILVKKKFDVIYVTSPPLFVGLIGIILKMLQPNSKFIFEVRDLWPTNAIQTGEITNKTIINWSQRFEHAIYRCADHLVAVTEGICDVLQKNYYAKTALITNGIDVELFRKTKESNEEFIVVYSGNHGIVSGLETIIKAADILRNESIFFWLIGNGPVKNEIMKLAEEMQVEKVRFYDSVPIDKISDYLSQASVGISTSKKLQINKGRIPVKLFGYMACELPVLLSEWGESVAIIEKAGCGVNVEPENVKKLVEKIVWMKNNPQELFRMGKKGREYVEENYSREKQANAIEKLLKELVER